MGALLDALWAGGGRYLLWVGPPQGTLAAQVGGGRCPCSGHSMCKGPELGTRTRHRALHTRLGSVGLPSRRGRPAGKLAGFWRLVLQFMKHLLPLCRGQALGVSRWGSGGLGWPHFYCLHRPRGRLRYSPLHLPRDISRCRSPPPPPACCHNLSRFHCVWWSHTGLSSAFATPWEGGSLGEGPGGRPKFLGGCRTPLPLASPSPEFPS